MSGRGSAGRPCYNETSTEPRLINEPASAGQASVAADQSTMSGRLPLVTAFTRTQRLAVAIVLPLLKQLGDAGYNVRGGEGRRQQMPLRQRRPVFEQLTTIPQNDDMQ